MDAFHIFSSKIPNLILWHNICVAGCLDVGRVAICHSARGHPARAVLHPARGHPAHGVRHPAFPGPTCPSPTCPSGGTTCPCPTWPWPPCPLGATLSGADLHMATCPWGAAKLWSVVLIFRPFRVCLKICVLDQPLQDAGSRFKKKPLRLF